MSIEFGNNGVDENVYNLDCEVYGRDASGFDLSTGFQHSHFCIALIPDPVLSTEAAMFFYDWLPDVDHKGKQTHKPEVPSWINSPVNGPARLAVMVDNDWCHRPHLFVMSTGPEQKLRDHIGKRVNIKILPQSKDHLCDKASSIIRSLK